MKAAVLYGEHELPKYETVPDPVAGKGELLVKVEATGWNLEAPTESFSSNLDGVFAQPAGRLDRLLLNLHFDNSHRRLADVNNLMGHLGVSPADTA